MKKFMESACTVVFVIAATVLTVEVFPFVTVPYGWGNGWTIGSGR